MGLNDLIPDEEETKKRKTKKKFSPARKPPSSKNSGGSSSSSSGSNHVVRDRIPHDKHGDRRACPQCACVSDDKDDEDKWICHNDRCDFDKFLATWGSLGVYEGFLIEVDMVVVNDELRDIIPYIR